MGMLDKLRDSLFCQVSDVVLDVQTGAVGVKVKNMDGEVIRSLAKDGDKFTLSSNPLKELAVEIPAFAIRTSPDALKPGDIVVLEDDSYGFFVSKADDDAVNNPVITVVNAKTGRTGPVNIAHNRLFGTYGVLAVKNPFAGGGFGGGGGGGFESLLPLLLLGGEDLGDKKDLLLLLMLSGGQLGGDGGLGGLLPLLLLKGKKDGDGGLGDLLPLLMMGGAGGGGLGGMLPLLMGGFGGGEKKAAKAATPVVPRPTNKAKAGG